MLTVFAGVCITRSAAAAPRVGSLDVPDNQVALEGSFSPGMALDVSYGRRLRTVVGRSQLLPLAAFGFPIPGVGDGRSFDVELGGSWIVPFGPWGGVTPSATVFLATARTVSADLAGWGFDLGLRPGVYRPRWFAVAAVDFRPAVATHIRHRATSRDTFADRYPSGMAGVEGPRDGWYPDSAQRLRLGLEGGGTIRRRVTFEGGGGLQLHPGGLGIVAFPDIGELPFYFRVGVAAHF